MAVVVEGSSAMTSCDGRWPAGDVVELHDNPPHEERCDACVRVRIERRWIERGLRELDRNTRDRGEGER